MSTMMQVAMQVRGGGESVQLDAQHDRAGQPVSFRAFGKVLFPVFGALRGIIFVLNHGVCFGCRGVWMVSMLLPAREWPSARRWGQLWYEIFDFHANLTPEQCAMNVERGEDEQFIIGMHPHGILPLHSWLWCAYCDQYLSTPATKSGQKRREMYGFGGAADIVEKMPFLRNIMGWLSAASASYHVLRRGLVEGKSTPVNNGGRTPKHLYMLPGGVAEVFTSCPGDNTIVFKDRYGLTRLSLETGAKLIPCYVFGGTDFFENIATADGFLARLSRKFKMGIVGFYGKWGCPFIPYTPKVTMVIGDPLDVEKWDVPTKGRIPDGVVHELHARYLGSITELFEKYKIAAGHPNAKLVIK